MGSMCLGDRARSMLPGDVHVHVGMLHQWLVREAPCKNETGNHFLQVGKVVLAKMRKPKPSQKERRSYPYRLLSHPEYEHTAAASCTLCKPRMVLSMSIELV